MGQLPACSPRSRSSSTVSTEERKEAALMAVFCGQAQSSQHTSGVFCVCLGLQGRQCLSWFVRQDQRWGALRIKVGAGLRRLTWKPRSLLRRCGRCSAILRIVGASLAANAAQKAVESSSIVANRQEGRGRAGAARSLASNAWKQC